VLSTQNAPLGLNDTPVTTTIAPSGGTLTRTGLLVEMSGRLVEPTNRLSGNATLTLDGGFRDTTGQSAAGDATVLYTPDAAPIVNATGAFYVDRD